VWSFHISVSAFKVGRLEKKKERERKKERCKKSQQTKPLTKTEIKLGGYPITDLLRRAQNKAQKMS
jgi:hypothetical protein